MKTKRNTREGESSSTKDASHGAASRVALAGDKKGGKSKATELEELELIHLYAAGIDVGAAENFVCVPAHALAPGEANVRSFGAFTKDMDDLVDWLKICRITTVAMEATGICWMCLYDKIEAAAIEVVLVDPHSVRHVPGRKSDVMDCQWLQQLHTYGLLRGAFRPEASVRRLRVLSRHRADLVCEGASHVQQAQKALVQMNVQLGLVVSDINGETGLRIIDAILKGERDPKALVKLRDPRIKKSTVEEMEAGLTGNYSEEHLFVLEQNIESWRFYQKQLEACDQQIESALKAMPAVCKEQAPPPPPKVAPAADVEKSPKKRERPLHGNNAPMLDFSEQIRRICGVDLMKVCGLNLLSVLMLIAEIGVDMGRWRNEKAFCSWLGLCPGAKISGGKKLSRRTRHVVNRASVLLRMAALAAGRTDSWLGRFYRRKRAHLGAPKAITATARKLACVIYHMLKYQEEFMPLDVALYEIQSRDHRMRRLRKQAEELGFELIQKQQAA
jgi:transposase